MMKLLEPFLVESSSPLVPLIKSQAYIMVVHVGQAWLDWPLCTSFVAVS